MYTLVSLTNHGAHRSEHSGLELRDAFIKAAHRKSWELKDETGQTVAHGRNRTVIDAAPWLDVPGFMQA